jgi:hypothetical protein
LSPPALMPSLHWSVSGFGGGGLLKFLFGSIRL